MRIQNSLILSVITDKTVSRSMRLISRYIFSESFRQLCSCAHMDLQAQFEYANVQFNTMVSHSQEG